MKKIIKWLYPGLGIKRWILLATLGIFLASSGMALILQTDVLGSIERALTTRAIYVAGAHSFYFGLLMILVGFSGILFGLRQAFRSVLSYVFPIQQGGLVELIYQRTHLSRGPKIVVVGGGTGLSVLLRGLKQYTSNITAIVTVADDGGSSGRLRGEFGVLPPGDIRNCLVALADTEPLMERLFEYRFSGASELGGHSFGNLFLVAMAENLGDFMEAIAESSKVLAVRGRVLPSTLESVKLGAEFVDGEQIIGESAIPEARKRIKKMFLEPADPSALPEAVDAIRQADAIVLGPGSLYTSIIPNLLVPNLKEAIIEAEAPVYYVCNVMTQAGETDDYTAGDHLEEILNYLSTRTVDYVLVNSGKIPQQLINKYLEEDSHVVKVDRERLEDSGAKVICRDMVTKKELIRHDSKELADQVVRLVILNKYRSERKVTDFYFWGEKLRRWSKDNSI